jgi:hypothetical protein
MVRAAGDGIDDEPAESIEDSIERAAEYFMAASPDSEDGTGSTLSRSIPARNRNLRFGRREGVAQASARELFDLDEMWKLLQSINRGAPQPQHDRVLEKQFRAWWPDLERDVVKAHSHSLRHIFVRTRRES